MSTVNKIPFYFQPTRKKMQCVRDISPATPISFMAPPLKGPTLYQSFKAQKQNGGGSYSAAKQGPQTTSEPSKNEGSKNHE